MHTRTWMHCACIVHIQKTVHHLNHCGIFLTAEQWEDKRVYFPISQVKGILKKKMSLYMLLLVLISLSGTVMNIPPSTTGLPTQGSLPATLPPKPPFPAYYTTSLASLSSASATIRREEA